jgi:hypothetical protein
MRLLPALPAILLPDLAFAHVGHLGELAGHSHWIALGALGLATTIGLLGGRGKDRAEADTEEAADEEATEDAQEVPA